METTEVKKDFFRKFTEMVIRYKFAVLLFWIVITVMSVVGALHIHEVLQGEGSYVRRSDSFEQNELLRKYFPKQSSKNIIVTFKSQTEKIDAPEYRKVLENVNNLAAKDKNVSQIYGLETDPAFVSRDKKSTFLLIGLNENSAGVTSQSAETLATAVRKLKFPPGIEFHITGNQIIIGDMTKISETDSTKAEKRILPVVAVLLIIVFGALMSALIPLAISFISIIITLGCLFLIGHYFELTMFCKAITSMIGLGVGLDYCLFMVSRFREELDKGHSPEKAAIETAATAGKAVCYSGLAVSTGMAALLIPDLSLTRSIGFSGLLVVIISLCLSLTLLPVIFALMGDKINYPAGLHKLVKFSSLPKNFWAKWAGIVMKRPVLFLVSGVSVLMFISYFTLNMKLWNSSVLLMPEELDSRKGFIQMLNIDPGSKFSPIGISFETRDGSSIYQRKNLEEIYNFSRKITVLPEISKVLGIVNPNSDITIDAYQNLYTNYQTMQLFQMSAPNPFVSAAGDKSIMWAIHKDSEIQAADLETVKRIREIRNNFVSKNLNILIGGGGAINVDFQDALYRDFPLIILVIILATYLIMFSLLGSVLLPIKAIVMNLISVTASYGWLVLVLQYGFTAGILGINQIPGAIMTTTPLVLFCIIFGLSMDYEIFMMSRIKEEYDKTGDTNLAVVNGLEKSGGIITSAAMIMIIVFSAFSFSDVILVQEIGLGLATAVFIDATLIRLVLVPSVMKILGKAAWWIPDKWKGKLALVKLEH